MKRQDRFFSLPFTRPLLALALAGASLLLGCKTYHYYDIDVAFDTATITKEQASVLQLCEMVVSGADSHTADFPSSVVGDSTSVCPIDTNYPDLGHFEFATFEDSGTLNFTVNGYKAVPHSSSDQAADLCTSGSASVAATDAITETGTTVKLMGFDSGKCPVMVTP